MKWERVALLGLGGLGGYMLWRKRSTIMRFFSEKGISAPWLTKTVGDAVRSGVNKVSEVFDHSLGKQPTSSESRSESRIAS